MSEREVASPSAPPPLPWEVPDEPVVQQRTEEVVTETITTEAAPEPQDEPTPADDDSSDTPAEPTPPPSDPRLASVERELAELRQERQQRQAEEAQRQQEAAHAERQQQFTDRWNQAKQYAARIDDEAERNTYLDQVYNQTISEYDQLRQQDLDAAQRQWQAQTVALLVPGFAEHHGRENGLTPRQIEILKKQPTPEAIIALTEAIKATAADDGQTKRSAQQAYANQTAKTLKESGVTNTGGITGANPVSSEIKPGRREELRGELASILAQS